MLDFELAEIYGYETKNFNRQVKNNIKKFEGEDFMFQLTAQEVEELSKCKNFTLNRGTGRGTNIKYNPYVFTEQGLFENLNKPCYPRSFIIQINLFIST